MTLIYDIWDWAAASELRAFYVGLFALGFFFLTYRFLNQLVRSLMVGFRKPPVEINIQAEGASAEEIAEQIKELLDNPPEERRVARNQLSHLEAVLDDDNS